MTLPDLNALTLDELYRSLASGGLTRRLFELMRDEDVGAGATRGDVTTLACFAGKDQRVVARLVARDPCRVAGLATIAEMTGVFGVAVDVRLRGADGRAAAEGELLAELEGPWDGLLTLERSLLNLCARLSGVATTTARYVAEMQRVAPGSPARLFDTRKTTPGLRILEKYAVRCGGGMCHRIGLHDALLIKDNHLAHVGPGQLAAFVRDAAARARADRPIRFVEVEVDRLEQLDELLALEEGVVDIVLLDNMDEPTLREAVEARDRAGARVELEASGGVTLESVGAFARTGVERISVGALTHGARGVDLALDVD
jgi:nicotinate-nucleotide pyrophosphorylase (carboxylating)